MHHLHLHLYICCLLATVSSVPFLLPLHVQLSRRYRYARCANLWLLSHIQEIPEDPDPHTVLLYDEIETLDKSQFLLLAAIYELNYLRAAEQASQELEYLLEGAYYMYIIFITSTYETLDFPNPVSFIFFLQLEARLRRIPAAKTEEMAASKTGTGYR